MQMAEWRKSTFPKCPKCERGGTHTGHRNCPQDGKLWVDILTGTQKCDACGQSWSLEKAIHHCSCGAKFKGGELWQGMATELGSYADLVWLKRLGISKGTLETEFLGWWKEPNESNKVNIDTGIGRNLLTIIIVVVIYIGLYNLILELFF